LFDVLPSILNIDTFYVNLTNAYLFLHRISEAQNFHDERFSIFTCNFNNFAIFFQAKRFENKRVLQQLCVKTLLYLLIISNSKVSLIVHRWFCNSFRRPNFPSLVQIDQPLRIVTGWQQSTFCLDWEYPSCSQSFAYLTSGMQHATPNSLYSNFVTARRALANKNDVVTLRIHDGWVCDRRSRSKRNRAILARGCWWDGRKRRSSRINPSTGRCLRDDVWANLKPDLDSTRAEGRSWWRGKIATVSRMGFFIHDFSFEVECAVEFRKSSRI